MKVGIITFHASHNYGSMLQAYALQKTVESLGHTCEIINFRTDKQRIFYSPIYKRSLVRLIGKFVFRPKLSYTSIIKHSLFEKFLDKEFKLTEREFSTYDELDKNAPQYDAYISGSDQIWNVACFDWDLAYGLKFVKKGLKIAYSPSMGPRPTEEIWKYPDKFSLLIESIRSYDKISVREPIASDVILDSVGITPEVTLDPTLLLSSYQWKELENDKPTIKKDYILLYTPWPHDDLYDKALEISLKFGLKIVSPMPYGYTAYRKNTSMIYHEKVGPKEFLNLIRNASLVIGASFHAAAFSVIFGKQLYAYDGMKDSRVSTLLKLTGLETFAEEPKELLAKERLSEIYAPAHTKLAAEVKKSLDFLRNALQD